MIYCSTNVQRMPGQIFQRLIYVYYFSFLLPPFSLDDDLDRDFSTQSGFGFGLVCPFSMSSHLFAVRGVRFSFAGGDLSITVPLLFALEVRFVSRRPVSLLEARRNDSRMFQLRRLARNHKYQMKTCRHKCQSHVAGAFFTRLPTHRFR